MSRLYTPAAKYQIVHWNIVLNPKVLQMKGTLGQSGVSSWCHATYICQADRRPSSTFRMSSRLADFGGRQRWGSNRRPANRCSWLMPAACSHLALLADSSMFVASFLLA